MVKLMYFLNAQMMKAVDTMLNLEKQERVKLNERLRETEKRLTELEQIHEEKLESLQKVTLDDLEHQIPDYISILIKSR